MKRSYLNKIISAIVLISCLLCQAFILTSCAGNKIIEPVASDTFISLDTVITVSLYKISGDNTMSYEAVLSEAKKVCEKYNALFDPDDPSSDIYKINHAGGGNVNISEDTAYLIEKSLDLSLKTDGKIDISIYPLKLLWNEGKVPSPDDINKALSHVDFNNIILDTDKNTVCLSDPEASIDLGFIAKGYIADKIKERLISCGVKSAIIDLGGNVQTIGSKPDNSTFNIGIKKPFSKNGEVIDTINVSDISVVTAGTYERYFEEDGKIYHHILDPSTGYPADSGIVSATIIYPESTTADALSTACIVLGYDKAVKLLDDHPLVKAVFVTDSGETLYYNYK